MESPIVDQSPVPDLRKDIRRRVFQVLITVILTALILFISAGSISWIWAWIYMAADVVLIIVNSLIFKPEVVAERGRKKENVEKWDKVVSVFLLIAWIAIYLVPGLDFRFGWTGESSLMSHIYGLIVFFPGIAFVTWSMVSNTFFSTSVRIQYERNHTVADSGPYNYIRHPGYLGMIVYNLGTPLIFGSYWAFIPAISAVIILLIRTKLEDDTLKQRLPGYKEYSERTRYRILPLIW